MKKISLIFIVIVAIATVVPIVTFNYEENYLSEIDNRYLNELTDYSSETIDNYVNDRIGLREWAVEVYNKLNANIFSTLTHPDYMFGSSADEIFSKTSKGYEYDEYFDEFLISVKEIQDYCIQRGKEFYFVFNPSKNNVYTEYLSKSINYDDSWIDTFINKAKEYGINIIDNHEYLNSIKNDAQIYCHKYDPIHWNDTGAYYGLNNVLNYIHNDLPEVETIDINAYEIKSEIKEFLPESNYRIDEEVDNYQLKNDVVEKTLEKAEKLKINDTYRNFNYYESNNDNGVSCLMFGSSFVATNDRGKKFLAPAFSNLVIVHNYQNIYDIDYYMNIFEPECVIFEVADFTFSDNYFSRDKMHNMNLYPVLAKEDLIIEYSDEYVEAFAMEYADYRMVLMQNPNVEFDSVYLELDEDIYECQAHDDSFMEVTLLYDRLWSADTIRCYYIDHSKNSGYCYDIGWQVKDSIKPRN